MWTVYALIDDRDGTPFYIGVTLNPAKRESEHRNSFWSDMTQRIVRIEREGGTASLRALSLFGSHRDALCEERRLIRATPNIVNRVKYEMLSSKERQRRTKKRSIKKPEMLAIKYSRGKDVSANDVARKHGIPDYVVYRIWRDEYKNDSIRARCVEY